MHVNMRVKSCAYAWAEAMFATKEGRGRHRESGPTYVSVLELPCGASVDDSPEMLGAGEIAIKTTVPLVPGSDLVVNFLSDSNEAMNIALPDVPRTYPHEAANVLRNEYWNKLPVSEVPITELIPTQSDVAIEHIVRILNGIKEDEHVKAVRHKDKLYLHDGHHRWLIALLRGDKNIKVHVWSKEQETE